MTIIKQQLLNNTKIYLLVLSIIILNSTCFTVSTTTAKTISFNLKPSSIITKKVSIKKGDTIIFILHAPSGYKIHDSAGSSGYGLLYRQNTSPPTKSTNKYYVVVSNMSVPVAAKFSGHLIPIGHGGSGDPKLSPFYAEASTIPAKITISANPAILCLDSTTDLTATVTNSDGDPLNNETVTFSTGQTASTNNYGKAMVDNVSFQTKGKHIIIAFVSNLYGQTEAKTIVVVAKAGDCYVSFQVTDKRLYSINLDEYGTGTSIPVAISTD